MSRPFVRLRWKRAQGGAVYEHRCERDPNTGLADRYRPRILWLQVDFSKQKSVWCIEQNHRDRFEIFACPWCYVHLPPPDGKECLCGAEEVRESRGTHEFETLHDFQLPNGASRRVRVKATVREFVHEPDCPALRMKEIDP